MSFKLEKRAHHWVGHFQCMASPCEVLLETKDEAEATVLIQLALDEAFRIEHKYSRYRSDNIVHKINSSFNQFVEVDEETHRLLDYAQNCFELSDGLFDITSGVFRTIWDFKQQKLPTQKDIERILPLVGWDKVKRKNNNIRLAKSMQIDFGGIGKEYAVDRVVDVLKHHTALNFMVNFGGDCHVSGPQKDNMPWLTGIENPNQQSIANDVLKLSQGALATSGDVYRFIIKNGQRYGHIINPKTGWPATDAPRSVTVAAASCSDAGILSTLAMLQGADAEEFLEKQDVKYWCYR